MVQPNQYVKNQQNNRSYRKPVSFGVRVAQELAIIEVAAARISLRGSQVGIE